MTNKQISKQMIPHIVVIGGGAGGLELVTKLGHSLGKHKKARITLIDHQLTHIWKPLLHEVAVGTLDSNQDEINFLTHAHKHHYDFVYGSLVALDRAKKEVIVSPVHSKDHRMTIDDKQLHYDYLVMAVGSIANTFNVPGADKYCYYLDTLQEAQQFHDYFIQKILHIRQSAEEDKKESPLSVIIIGSGASGVELAAELAYAIKMISNMGLANNRAWEIPIHLIEASSSILPQLKPQIAVKVASALQKLGIQIHTNMRVCEVTEDGVVTTDGTLIKGNLKVWVAGVKAPEFLRSLDGLETNRINQLVVKPTLQTSEDEAIFAFGDCAACPTKDSGFVPPRAQAAHQQASLLAKSFIGYIKKDKPWLIYTYTDYGSLISLSDDAVGFVMGKFSKSVLVEGKIARIVYLSLYRSHQLNLHGLWHMFLTLLGAGVTKRTKPRLKLH